MSYRPISMAVSVLGVHLLGDALSPILIGVRIHLLSTCCPHAVRLLACSHADMLVTGSLFSFARAGLFFFYFFSVLLLCLNVFK